MLKYIFTCLLSLNLYQAFAVDCSQCAETLVNGEPLVHWVGAITGPVDIEVQPGPSGSLGPKLKKTTLETMDILRFDKYLQICNFFPGVHNTGDIVPFNLVTLNVCAESLAVIPLVDDDGDQMNFHIYHLFLNMYDAFGEMNQFDIKYLLNCLQDYKLGKCDL